MTLPIFPTSPLPANFSRQPLWGESAFDYDSGAYQAGTAWAKPLYGYTLQLENIPRSKQSSLHYFWNNLKGRVSPWLFEDPYDDSISAVICVRTGTNPSTFRLLTDQGFQVIAKSGSVLITSTKSGALTQGSHYILDQDTGIITASLRPSSADLWTASASYFRKCVFSVQYAEQSVIWNQFSGAVSWKEIALP